MAEKFDLSLVIKAVDKATAPLREVNKRINKMTAPVRKLNNAFAALSAEAGVPKLMKAFGGVGSAVGRVGRETLALGVKVAAMAAAGGFALFSLVKGAVDAGDNLATMAQRVGLSVDAYAQLQFAAAQADVEQEQFNGAMDQFNKRLGEMKAGTGPLLGFLKRISPALLQQVKGAKNTEEAFDLMTRAMVAVEDPAKRAALSAAVFGRSGLQMGQFLGQGTEEIKKQREEFFRLSGSQEDFAKGAGILDNEMRRTEIAFLGLRNAAAGALFPALTKVAQAVTAFMSKNREGLRVWAEQTGAAISAWVQSGGLTELTKNLGDIAKTVGWVIEKIGGLKGVLVVIGGIMAAPLVSAIVSLGGAMFSLGSAAIPIITKAAMLLWPVLVSLGTALAPFLIAAAPFIAAAVGIGAAAYQIYKNWEPIKLLFSEVFDYVGKIVSKVGGIKGVLMNPIGSAFKGAAAIAGDLFGSNAPMPGADAKIPGARAQSTENRLIVDINGAPKGTTVTPDRKNKAPIEYSVGSNLVTQ